MVTTISEMVAQGIPLTTANLKRLIQQGGVRSYTLNDLFKEYNQILENRVKSKEITKIVADERLDCLEAGDEEDLPSKVFIDK